MTGFFFLCLLLLSARAFAQGELTIFVSGAMKEPVEEAGAVFARSSGHTLVYVSDTTGVLQKRLAAGERADLVVDGGAAASTRLQKEQRVGGGEPGRSCARVDWRWRARRRTVARPLDARDVQGRSSRGPLRRLRHSGGGRARPESISKGLLRQMGIADAMKSKTVYRTLGSEVADAVANGDAETRHHLHQRTAGERACEGRGTVARRGPDADDLFGGDRDRRRKR